MDSLRSNLILEKADEVNAWIISFEAMCRSKNIDDTKTGSSVNSAKTDKFIEKCGTKALLKIIS